MNPREGFLVNGRAEERGSVGNAGVIDPVVRLVVFTLHGQRYALEISRVVRVLHAVEITPLPKAPDIVLGAVNVRGEIIPVINLKKRFGLPDSPPALDDRLILAQTARRAVALLADAVTQVTERPEAEIINPVSVLPGLEYLRGVVQLADGMTFIYDLDTLLSLEEEARVENAIHAQV
jgi:purine-binding chemotaxis protein CheW